MAYFKAKQVQILPVTYCLKYERWEASPNKVY